MKTHKLLIVDDDEMIGKTIKTVAELCNFHVIYTDSAMMFFEQLALFKPDVIVVDLILPNVDGMQLIKKLVELNSKAKLVIISGAGKRVVNSSALSAQEQGMDILGVLNKPFRTAEIRQLLSNYTKLALTEAKLGRSLNGPATNSWFPTVDELQHALDNDLITVQFQPQISSQTELLVGFEALARWHDEEHGAVKPDYFIQLAERTHLIDKLLVCVFNQALAWFADLQDRHENKSPLALHLEPANLSLSVNLSVINLYNDELPEELLACCEEHGVAASSVVFELTESAAMENPTQMLDSLTRLRLSGFGLSIDDFGTGYSSLIQLARLPFSELKVDQSFVATATESNESRAVVRSVVDLAKSLDLTSVAEGVETEAQARYLKEIGCNVLQGFYIAKPMSIDDCDQWIKTYYGAKEDQRLKALRALNLINTQNEARFDRLTQLAQRLFNISISTLTLIEEKTVWLKSNAGDAAVELEREHSFCAQALGFQDVFIVNDASTHERFSDNPHVVAEDGVRFYAGCPLQLRSGERIGTLCIADSKTRTFSDQEKLVLKELASLMEEELEVIPDLDIDKRTGLFNRRAVESRARGILRMAAHGNLSVTMLLIDIANFHAFNDEYGQRTGDLVLKELAESLNTNFRRCDTIGRFGGDKFIVLMVNAHNDSVQSVDAILERLQADINTGINPKLATGERQINIFVGSSSVEKMHSSEFYDLLYEAEMSLNRSRYGQID